MMRPKQEFPEYEAEMLTSKMRCPVAFENFDFLGKGFIDW
jgi:hypothetical protein